MPQTKPMNTDDSAVVIIHSLGFHATQEKPSGQTKPPSLLAGTITIGGGNNPNGAGILPPNVALLIVPYQ